ncbi:hypothetical protein [Halocatena pleomorpha]|uniref:Uncharacterized protein n=1 Tax=Halocatena pleomorpha TaxID=1785090 RepID=A0A3P3RBX6_9EURY|nr:hypothetical protein [Halocatena pleomorpha]RRJ29973.1 hypothetical protein EIK79_11530 [Halocatena pleomorpha]
MPSHNAVEVSSSSVFVDRQWASDHRQDDVRGHLPPSVRKEFTLLSPDNLGELIKGFWGNA